jgi:hypothetical protein
MMPKPTTMTAHRSTRTIPTLMYIVVFVALVIFSNNNNNNNNEKYNCNIFVSGQDTPIMAPISQQTIGPSYSKQCLICNTTDMIVSNGSQIVTVPVVNRTTNCSDLYFGGLLALIPPEGCPLSKSAGCNCTLMPKNSSDQPSVSPSVLPSANDLTKPPIGTPPTMPIMPPVSVPFPKPAPPTSKPISNANTMTLSSIQSILFTVVCGTVIIAIAL